MWFIGVIRDRIGEHEDRFFATVFLAMLFASAAVAGSLISIFGATPGMLVESGIYIFGRVVAYEIMTVYTIKRPVIRFFRMINHTSTERTIAVELYRIVKVLGDAMTLSFRIAFSDLSNTITKSG